MRRILIVLSVALLLSACSANPYPFEASTPGGSETGPATIGQPVEAVILFLQLRPGDRLELVSAEPIGSFAGADMKLWLSRPVAQPDSSSVIGESVEVLPGAVVNASVSASPGPDNDVGIVAQMTPHQPGTFTVTDVLLTYRLNGGDAVSRDGISVLWTVCADDPAPTDCAEGSTLP